MGGNPHYTGPRVVGGLEVMHRADAGQQKRGDFRVGDFVSHRLDVFEVGIAAETVIEG
ncbi:hypothetical protein D3C84_1299750 [compost metagenome]